MSVQQRIAMLNHTHVDPPQAPRPTIPVRRQSTAKSSPPPPLPLKGSTTIPARPPLPPRRDTGGSESSEQAFVEETRPSLPERPTRPTNYTNGSSHSVSTVHSSDSTLSTSEGLPLKKAPPPVPAGKLKRTGLATWQSPSEPVQRNESPPPSSLPERPARLADSRNGSFYSRDNDTRSTSSKESMPSSKEEHASYRSTSASSNPRKPKQNNVLPPPQPTTTINNTRKHGQDDVLLPPPPPGPPLPSRRKNYAQDYDAQDDAPPPLPTRPNRNHAAAQDDLPPPIPLASRPDLSKIQATKPRTECLKCRDFSYPDAHATRFPRESLPSPNLAWLATQLTAPFPSPTDKARVIFTWLHHNIEYDTYSFFNGCVEYAAPSDTFTKGLAVCQGYADLFEVLATHSGLEAKVISGHGKGIGYHDPAPGSPLPPYQSGHAWNVVKIDGGKWKLIDA